MSYHGPPLCFVTKLPLLLLLLIKTITSTIRIINITLPPQLLHVTAVVHLQPFTTHGTATS